MNKIIIFLFLIFFVIYFFFLNTNEHFNSNSYYAIILYLSDNPALKLHFDTSNNLLSFDDSTQPLIVINDLNNNIIPITFNYNGSVNAIYPSFKNNIISTLSQNYNISNIPIMDNTVINNSINDINSLINNISSTVSSNNTNVFDIPGVSSVFNSSNSIYNSNFISFNFKPFDHISGAANSNILFYDKIKKLLFFNYNNANIYLISDKNNGSISYSTNITNASHFLF